MLEKLDVETEISTAQNTFYEMFCDDFEGFFKDAKKFHGENIRAIMLNLLEIGKKLNINLNFYKDKIDSLTGKIN